MQLTLLKSKIHRATVTDADLDYEGSCAIDADLLEASGLREYERVEIYNVSNGERFATYAIRGERGSGVISMNGAAAHKASVGDLVILCAYAGLAEEEAEEHQPRIVWVDERNRIRRTSGVPERAA
ncbi:aspartate decarboxylase [Thiohalorhabdus denitrificans]|uniref:Aspartate 1-decarboxylase n=1 Tax=Thiohalorhabdus denitrificans TaxID=381306 RepID=A0A0N8PN09_9GAMM|nr:aspartate 1-decarboxylase [Thiohalorhabdus denitrificans]KPV40213.1 aspartate decarboxylase [Thiohalorhabdus denitrificans]SCX84331.1 L-aspartate 1-decarboxylase [Thiohalorhabdus denitrificans]